MKKKLLVATTGVLIIASANGVMAKGNVSVNCICTADNIVDEGYVNHENYENYEDHCNYCIYCNHEDDKNDGNNDITPLGWDDLIY